MNKYKILFLLFVTILALQQLKAQTSKSPVAFVNGLMFTDQKAGITKYVELQKTIAREFQPKQDELKNMQTEYESLRKQVQNNPTAPDAQRKADKAEQMNKDITNKGYDLQAQYNKRYEELLQPLQLKMNLQLKQWCAQKGFVAIIDVSKNPDGMLVWVDEDSINNLTTELIRHLNATL